MPMRIIYLSAQYIFLFIFFSTDENTREILSFSSLYDPLVSGINISLFFCYWHLSSFAFIFVVLFWALKHDFPVL